MSSPADVRNIQMIREFRGSLLRFQDDASQAISMLHAEIQRVLHWLQRDRPQYWNRQVQLGHNRVAEARVAYTRCRMRQVGDIKPDCFVEQKALQKAKRDLEIAYEKVKETRRWIVKAQHEVSEFNSRVAQLTRCVDGDLPKMAALIERLTKNLEDYASAAAQMADEVSLTRRTADADAANSIDENEDS